MYSKKGSLPLPHLALQGELCMEGKNTEGGRGYITQVRNESDITRHLFFFFLGLDAF